MIKDVFAFPLRWDYLYWI